MTDRLCLGLESTAHTFSAGVVSFLGEVISVINDTYVPEEGGLHPFKTSEHHVACFDDVISKSLEKAGITASEVDLIAFSQGPGLGPCLRVGATVARTLHLVLDTPLVGVNHCVGHVEIGRLMCNMDDPLTLYVSGGNTMVSAFDCGRYQVFGETLDIALGNMLDTFARKMGLQHPGGPKIEKLAVSSQGNYIELPYTVKGMDLSFSGLLTASTRLHPEYSLEDISYSLQETAFAMLAEVTERALAHTEKDELLLTGGVAANSRLQEMIKLIAEEHGSRFDVVPQYLAGDNGAMIAWNGILAYRAEQRSLEMEDSNIIPKWRLDQVPITWRQEEGK